MLLEATLISISATGLGIYYCIGNNILTPECVKACSDDLDKKCFELFMKIGNKFDEAIESIDKKMDEWIKEDEKKNDDINEEDATTEEIIAEEEQPLLDESDDVELELRTVDIKEPTPESTKSKSTEEFIMLYDEN